MKSALPKILLVDDEAPTLEALERLLRPFFTVFKAADGEQGLALLTEHRDIAVILSDYRMPKMLGTDFLIKAKEIVPNAARAILSGQIDLENLTKAINQSAIHRLILKPWDNEYLKVQIFECYQHHKLLSEKNLLEHLSITDPVTSLTNHRYFQETLKTEIERAKRHNRLLSLIMIDVDHFKSYNDRFGHPEGDKLLAALARLLSTQVRNIDHVSRYGGEEFALILPDTPLKAAYDVAERIRQQIAKFPFTDSHGTEMNVTISLGVSAFPEHANNSADLIVKADQALYLAKRQGRNQTVVAS